MTSNIVDITLTLRGKANQATRDEILGILHSSINAHIPVSSICHEFFLRVIEEYEKIDPVLKKYIDYEFKNDSSQGGIHLAYKSVIIPDLPENMRSSFLELDYFHTPADFNYFGFGFKDDLKDWFDNYLKKYGELKGNYFALACCVNNALTQLKIRVKVISDTIVEVDYLDTSNHVGHVLRARINMTSMIAENNWISQAANDSI